ncbi:MAG: hypothetical protein JO332_11430 [Planctomycetaceae bacterium]|nr:hypothetical protein [Planctomycetaceae bacterium]
MTPLPLALLLFGPLLLQGKPAATPPELNATVQYSPSGDLTGPWQTYVAELDSRSTRDLDLLLRIEDDSFLSVATRRERLSPGARKRVFLYAPATSYQRGIPARYRITDSRGAELASGTLPNPSRGYAPQAYQVALFCRIPAAEDDFGFPSTVNSQEVRCGRLSAATFPDRWIGLMSLDLLVVHDAPLDELTTDQTRALQDYVRQGGVVLFVPGSTPSWFQHPTIQSLAAIRAESPLTVRTLPRLNGTFGDFRNNDAFLGQALLNGDSALPDGSAREFARFDAGFGRVLALGVDFRRAPFDTWAGRRAFWTEVLTRSPRWFQEDVNAFPVSTTVAQREELFLRMGRLINPYPSFGLILGLAVVFLAVVGPANYAVLWKLRRTLLLVVTVPGISIAFLAIIVLLGYLLKGTSTVAHSARLLSTRSGVGIARETHLYSLFSPANRTYDVSLEPGSYGPFDRWNLADRQTFRRRQEAMTTLNCETGSSLTIKSLATGQWQSWDLETRALRDLGKGVRFSNEGAVLRIANGSARPIERGVYIQTGHEGGVVPFGPVAPGQSTDVPLTGYVRSGGDAMAFPAESLGDTLLRPWLDSIVGPSIGISQGNVQRFLLCVLRDEGTPVDVDARLSGRSRTVTLLHVAEAP